MLRLPSFSNLIAFDAVARHGTLTRAGVELNVSQPAISRRIAALEADLGRTLFNRSTKPLTLTKAGVELFEVLRSGLSRLESAIARIRHDTDVDTVTISAGSGFAAYWLIPRLPEMQAAFPRLRLRIVSQSHSEEVDTAGDLQVRFGDGVWDGVAVCKMFGEQVFPVCSPLYLERRRGRLTMAQLQAANLLDMKVTRQPWYDWISWFETVGVLPKAALDVVYFDSYPLVVSAALAGQGVCLGWAGLLDEFLASGALVRVTGHAATSSRGYFVTHDPVLTAESPVPAITGWLLERGSP